MIIDSGTVVTNLRPTVYIRRAAVGVPGGHGCVPAPTAVQAPQHVCYNFTGYDNVTVPRIALTFRGGVTVDLDVPSGILSGGCLAFAAVRTDNSTTFLGNVNQSTFEVLYDVKGGRVGFRPGAC
ncbi:hypothetical protein PR202_ga17084 [Eleusine coracana subsp. coracana]|uniref:Peptidase A1 domain-containing protein n=1 Tax=Eleusine coracana subsp. coracana TaxID=191504 RepID=A0AAV5CN75_ELECO|nr:hypothetical protein PR202_ga17084 [Eleusine coracana subsp. coracana]